MTCGHRIKLPPADIIAGFIEILECPRVSLKRSSVYFHSKKCASAARVFHNQHSYKEELRPKFIQNPHHTQFLLAFERHQSKNTYVSIRDCEWQVYLLEISPQPASERVNIVLVPHVDPPDIRSTYYSTKCIPEPSTLLLLAFSSLALLKARRYFHS